VRPFRFQDVLDCTGAAHRSGAADLEILGVSTDTRTLREGDLFLALSGPNFDGNRFAMRAIEAGAAALLLAGREGENLAEIPDEMPLALHPEPRRAFGELGAWYRSTLTMPLIAITGSCGKTTTKNILGYLLGGRMRVVASPSSFNNDIGVPHTLLSAESDTQVLICELGSNNPGEIAALARLVRPTAGVVTNVGAVHLEGLGSLEGVVLEKGDLLSIVPPDGFCVLNADGPFFNELHARSSARVLSFSVEASAREKSDLNATELHFHPGGTRFLLNEREIESPLLGTHNVHNLLAALCVCLGLDIPLDVVIPRIGGLSVGPRRLERIELEGVTIFDDSYNSNPEALRAALQTFSRGEEAGRRVLVLGDMLELGALAAELHHRMGAEAAESGIDLLVLVGDLAKAAGSGASEKGFSSGALLHFSDADQAAEAVSQWARAGDSVLVKGSRGIGLEKVVEAFREQRGPRPLGQASS
jgi:UDP-N-acetylmuramoyl-tripeptide--D-alanyl-D-alanine ligase